MVNTVPEDLKRRAPRHDLARSTRHASARDTALSSDLSRVHLNGGASLESLRTAAALRCRL